MANAEEPEIVEVVIHAEEPEIVEVVIPLDSPACTICGDITVDLDGKPRACAKHPGAPLAPRVRGEN